MRKQKTLKRIAVIGNYAPRQCGIATFTTDLCETLAREYSEVECFVIPVNDTREGYAYPDRVCFELVEQDITSYRRAADYLNINRVDVVCLQHEYGIFGGLAGSHILTLLRELRMPIVTTLHTVLHNPDPQQRKVLDEIARLSDRLVVMSKHSSQVLQNIYGVPPEKIDLIPHGVPDVPFVDPNFYKDQLGVAGKTVLLTFGLLSPNKGIETVITALPMIISHHPDVVYIVLGATHPNVRKHAGEDYRLMLQRLAQEKGVARHVIFYNRFVSLEELIEFISAADIYITPYLNKEQTVSGTLAYTVAAGKAVISTPYWYAQELLADGRGILVPFRDPDALSKSIIALLDDETERHAMRKRAYLFGREMIWSKVVGQYMESFERARAERERAPRPTFVTKTLDERPDELPPLILDHLFRMTDSVGLLQHAIFRVPNYQEGYTTDDNARAVVVTTLLEELGFSNDDKNQKVPDVASRYLAFLQYAFNQQKGRFRNFMDYTHHWLDDCGSDDCHGRALWGLGTVAGHSRDFGLRGFAVRLFTQALPAILDTTSPRAWAYALLGVCTYLDRFGGDRTANTVRQELARRLMALYQANQSPDWPWFENILTYANAVLPHALLLCGQQIQDNGMKEAALKSLSWLISIQRAGTGSDHFVPIGSNGFYRRGGERARFDQQPIEAQTTVSACLAAYRITGDEMWLRKARWAFQWFLGRNDLGLPLYDPITGGCRDGLHVDGVNENQGAESTLAFLHALLELHLSDNMQQTTA